MATVSLYPNANSAALPGGQLTLAVVFESYVGSGEIVSASNVTIQITASAAPDGGEGTPVATTSSGITQTAFGQYQYVWPVPDTQTPGTYIVTWTGNRASDSESVTMQQVATIAPVLAPAPLPGNYCTVAQYQGWSGDYSTPNSLVQIKINRASEDLDRALVMAVYAVDGSGMPTDPWLINVLVRACAAQVQYLFASNDDAGVKREYLSTNVGGVAVTRAPGQQSSLPVISPRALSIMRVAGILPSAPLVNW